MTLARFHVVRLDLPLDTETLGSTLATDPWLDLAVRPVYSDDAAAWKALSAAHIYHVSSAKDDMPAHWFAAAPLLERCPDLLAVSTYGAGYDTVNVDDCTRAGVVVMNQAGSNANAVAEHTLALMLGVAKRIGEADKRLRRGEHFTRLEGMGVDLRGRTLGLVGIGHAGRRVAELARAFGMDVIAVDPHVAPAEVARRGAKPVGFEELLRRSDVVSLHCPLDASTAKLFDGAAFAAMKPRAIFVSTARGRIHDEAALHAALTSGHLAGAGLDVWAIEPPAPEHPLLALDNVIATFHTAGVTTGARQQMASMAANQIIDTARGRRPARLVNPEVWPAYVARYRRVVGRAVEDEDEAAADRAR